MASLLSHLRRVRHSDQVIVTRVRETLVESLYASPQSLVIGAVASSAVALTVAVASENLLLMIGAITIAMIGCIRIVDAVRLRHPRDQDAERSEAEVRRQELGYLAGALAYSMLLGVFGFVTLISTVDGVLQLLAVSTTVGYAAGIAGRNAGRPRIAIGQLCLASGPIIIGLLLSSEPLKVELAVVIALFVVAMMNITLQTYEMILKATVASIEKTALAEYNAALARRDDLTGVANRTAFREQLEAQLQALPGVSRYLAIHWLDLDRFKEINDSFGHLAGNTLLCGIAARLQHAFGTEGIIARLGGDEFAIVCRIDRQDEAAAIGREILRLVAQPVEHNGRSLHCSASVGIAIAPTDGGNADTLLKNADLALYRAKDSGRDQFCFYEPLMDEKVERSRHLASEMKGALERGEFYLLFQPIFDLQGVEVVSCEVLLRWTNRRYGMVSPVEFIPIAEDNGLIVEIGSWVIREACRSASQWGTDVKVAINLSPVQLRSPDLPSVILNALSATGFPAERLELEVTESVLLEDVDKAISALQEINSLQVCTTLDDFGTGYSSLSYLTKFPFQTLKIDRSFVSDLEQSPASVAIVQTIVELAAKLGMRTVAEGIETQAQLDQLRRTRCDAVQGYLLALPMSASMVGAMLADEKVRARG